MPKYILPRPARQLPDGNFEIVLTKGYVTVVSPEDADLAKRCWQIEIHKDGKTYATHPHPTTKMHRVILARVLNRPLLSSEDVDHWDNDPLNNKRSNLRLATRQQNASNRKMHTKNKAGLKGVSRHKDKYQAQIQVNYKKIYLGVYNTPEEAYIAYCEASKKYHGEFGRIE